MECSQPLETAALSGIAFASLLAFFAFIGFEDLANVVEEAKVPSRDIPRAMILTLLITTILYIVVAAVAVSAVSGTAGGIAGAAQSRISTDRAASTRHDQCDRDRCHTQHNPCADDDGRSGDLWHGARG